MDDSVVGEENAQDTVKRLREKLKLVQKEKAAYLDGWQRAKADMVNANKRAYESRKEFVQYANENLINEIIPVLDSFHMAMGNKTAWEKADKNWRVGVEYIAQQLKKILEDNGLKEVDPIGETFNPMIHESVGHKPVTKESENGKVVEVAQKGYSLNGKLLKVPKVLVGEM